MSDKVKCPLDPVHVVERHKLVYHLSRCIRTYRAGTHTPLHCPLDYSHLVEAGQMVEHVRNCSQLALAAPLFNVAPDASVVTGNLRLPDPPACMAQLVTGEWDEPAPAAAAARPPGVVGASAPVYDNYYLDDAASVSEAAASTASVATAWGRGRGRGRGIGPGHGVVGIGGGGGNQRSGYEEDDDDEQLRPGSMVAGGYVLKDLYYPPGYGPRGRFEERGSV